MQVLGTIRRRTRSIALALLPALVLRALTPAGFMPMHDAAGDVYLAFCPGVGDTVVSMPAGEHAHHDHHAGARQSPEHQNVCPYALSSGPALAYTVPMPVATQPRVDAPHPPHYSAVAVPTIQRAQSARAPPAPRVA